MKRNSQNAKYIKLPDMAWLALALIVFSVSAAFALKAIPRSWAAVEIMEVYQQKDGKIFGLEASLDIFDNPKLNGQKLIEPSSEGFYVFAVRNNADGAPLPYTLEIEADNPGNIPVAVSIEKNGAYIFGGDGIDNMQPLTELHIKETLLAGKKIDLYTLHWEWKTQSDEIDTIIGNDGTQLYALKIKATGTVKEGNAGSYDYDIPFEPGTAPESEPEPEPKFELELDTGNHFAYFIGYEDGTVRPDNNITRTEAVTIFFRLLTLESRAGIWSVTNTFSDVSAESWYNNAVSSLTNGGIINGYPDGTFRPNDIITRAEFAAIAARFSAKTEFAESPPVFTDVEGHWAEGYIGIAGALGYINGYPDGTFRPDMPITRAEVAVLLNNVLERRVESIEDLHADMKVWSDNPEDKWYYFAIQEATNSHYYGRNPGKKNEIWIELRDNPNWVVIEKQGANPEGFVY